MRRALVLWTDPGDSRGRSGLCKQHMEIEGLLLRRRFGKIEVTGPLPPSYRGSVWPIFTMLNARPAG
jgi:hypothetical protein